MNFRLRRLLPWTFPIVLVGTYIWSVLAATAAIEPSVGEIQDVQGRGWGVSALGEKYDKLGGDLVVMDEVVATDINSAMTLRFIDNTTMTLGPSAEITIDQMVYNPEDSDNDAVTLRLGKGSFYFVSGLVAKNKVTIITPTATIGIRGTELIINVDGDGATAVGVAKGHAFIRSNHDGRSVEVEVGNTARTNEAGAVGESFPGIDLTGDEWVDRKIPGVSEWLDDDEKEKKKDLTEFASNDKNFGLQDQGDDARKGKRAKNKQHDGEDGRDGADNLAASDEGLAFQWDDGWDGDEVASAQYARNEAGRSRDHEGRDGSGSERADSDRSDSDRSDSDRSDSDRSDSDRSDSDRSDSDRSGSERESRSRESSSSDSHDHD